MAKPSNKMQRFMSRNIVTIVMVPSIIAFHFGWSSMQYNRALVKEEEQIDLPVVTFAKYLWKKLEGSETSATPKVVAAKTENP